MDQNLKHVSSSLFNLCYNFNKLKVYVSKSRTLPLTYLLHDVLVSQRHMFSKTDYPNAPLNNTGNHYLLWLSVQFLHLLVQVYTLQ